MAISLGPNSALIDRPGGRPLISTPALVLDLDALEKNLQAMAAHCQRAGQSLRPHSKSHKSVAIAKRQLDAGAVGICCATIREAEAMVSGGVDRVLITSPVSTSAKIARLMRVHVKAPDLMVVVDGPDAIDALSAAAATQPHALKVLVDFDVGLHRTGAATDEDVALLARRIADADGLDFAGVQAYAGHLQHVEDYGARRDGAMAEAARVREAVERLAQLGLAPGIVTGGGTGTHDIDHRAQIFDELQAGSYIFTDVQYNAVRLTEGEARPFTPSLFVQASVVSTVHRSHTVIDAGLKSFSTDGPVPEFHAGAPEGATFRFMGDEHGAVVYANLDRDAPLVFGDNVSCRVPHCDPTVNLYDVYHCVRGDTLVDIWPIEARGNP